MARPCFQLLVCAALTYMMFQNAYGQAYLPATMTEAIDAALFLTKFKEAAVEAGYEGLFDSAMFNGTIFAPLDAAFPATLNVTSQDTSEVPAAGTTSSSSSLKGVIAFHMVPGDALYPMSSLKQGMVLKSREGHSLYIDRTPAGRVHVYGNIPTVDPLNFATILQYQAIKGGKAVLYVVDRVLKVPSTD